ncbi:MAG: tetratricopeptide repeat protein [Gemmatimonadaceae bacterium]|nr:tetratricopeptide repeat protein [Gemmatimonadaceae bacterium]
MKLLVIAALLAAPSIALGQTAADAQACERFTGNPVRAAEARASLEGLARGSDAAASSFAAGCLAVAATKWNDAAKAFERAVAANDRSAIAHYWLGRTYGVQVMQASVLRQPGLAKKTKAHLERAVEIDPDHMDARTGLMQFYLRAPSIVGGSVPKARQQVEEVRRRNAFRGGMLAGTVARREKQHAAAVTEYERLITQYPDSAAPYSSLASTYGDQREWDMAFRTIDRFIAAQPRALLAQYAIGRAAAESGQQLDRGEQGLRRYIAGATPSPGEPTIATAHLRLGAIHERRGDTDKARAEYQTALRLEPTLEAARAALGKLK